MNLRNPADSSLDLANAPVMIFPVHEGKINVNHSQNCFSPYLATMSPIFEVYSMDSEMSERTTVQLGKINTCLDVLEKTFGDKDSKNAIQRIKSLETIATKQHENYQTLLKELTDLKEQMNAGGQASEVKLEVGDIKKDLQSVQQSLTERK